MFKKKKFFFSVFKKKNCTDFFLYEFDVVYEKSRDLFEIFMMPPNYTHTQILKTKCTIPSVMKKIIPKLATQKQQQKNTLLHIYGETKKIYTRMKKKLKKNLKLILYKNGFIVN